MSISRLQHLRKSIHRRNLDAFMVTFPPHLRYICGFSGSSGIAFVTQNSSHFITDGRYVQQTKEEVRGWKSSIAPGSLFEELKAKTRFRSGLRIGIDGNTMTLTEFHQLKRTFPRVKFIPNVDTLEQLTEVKDDEEIANIRKAVEITDRVFTDLLGMIKPGMAELDIAAEISYRHRIYGAEKDAFEPIVVSGERSALPHGHPTSKKIRKGELLTLDFGAVYHGYHSDMTRTICIGRPSNESKNIYNTVLEAQVKAIDAAAGGMKSSDLDAAARNTIKDAGYDKYFRHSLGHGVGLQIHEAPRVSKLSKSFLQSGNAITIEPGVYVPGLGGVRIEDVIVITNTGCEVLTRSPKNLIQL